MPKPIEIRLKKDPGVLVIAFDDDSEFEYTFEYLRVHSPSAEVRGHGPGQETLQTGKEGVVITGIDPVGHYAVRLVFDDGHDTGLYNWQYLYDLGQNMEANWLSYLDRLEAAGYAREK
ncbi:MAG: gamma-butyrobetaine hydroxylase-like domain-containing protein [Woeseiaceae bacterium]